jgi:hypothetical protein
MLDNVVETIVAVDLVGVYGAVGDVVAISIRHGLGLIVSGQKSLAKLFLQLISRCKKKKRKKILVAIGQFPTAPGQAERLFAGAAGQDAQCLRRRTGVLFFHPDDPVVGLITQLDLLSIADFDGGAVLETDWIGQYKTRSEESTDESCSYEHIRC